MPTPPTGPTPGLPPEPTGPTEQSSGQSQKAPSGDDSKYAFLLKSPFAKMFAATGAMPTIKEMRGIMNGILQQEVQNIKQQDKQWKMAMKRLKRAIKGEG